MSQSESPSSAPSPDSHLRENTLTSESVYQGHFLELRRDRVALPDGREATREYVVHPGAVMIVAILPDGRLVMERQYRYPVRQTMIEFPAGKLDAGESPLDCARRELREETGYTARQWARAGLLHPVVAYSTEVIEIWFARELHGGARQLDEGEFLEVFSATPAQLHDWCRSGAVTDAKTLVGALWLHNVLGGAWTLDWRADSDT